MTLPPIFQESVLWHYLSWYRYYIIISPSPNNMDSLPGEVEWRRWMPYLFVTIVDHWQLMQIMRKSLSQLSVQTYWTWHYGTLTGSVWCLVHMLTLFGFCLLVTYFVAERIIQPHMAQHAAVTLHRQYTLKAVP